MPPNNLIDLPGGPVNRIKPVGQYSHMVPMRKGAGAQPNNDPETFLQPQRADRINPNVSPNIDRSRWGLRQAAEINNPDRFESFILNDGEKKVTEAADTRTPSTAIFTFNKEDHTMANVLRARLVKDERVLFAAYKVPHPVIPSFQLRIQTDGTITPKEALVAASGSIVHDLGQLSREFTKEFELRKIVHGEAEAN